jgi:hypothetical protein
MARSRNIKPSFFRNEVLAELPFQYRLLFIGLWGIADKEGRLEDRPKRIKADVFPYDDIDVDDGLKQLEAAGFINRYEAEGMHCVEVLKFREHQNPHAKEASSVLPSNSGESTGNSAASFPSSLLPLTDSPIPSKAHRSAPFSVFWEAYPRKKSKGDAEKAWKKIKPDGELLATMLDAIKAQTAERQAKTQKADFVPDWKYPATWLNSRAWEDVIDLPTSPRQPKTAKQLAEDKHREDMRLTAADVLRYGLRKQLPGEPDENYLARIKREVTEKIVKGAAA